MTDNLASAKTLTAAWKRARELAGSGKAASLSTRDLSAIWAKRFTKEEIERLVVPKRTLARRKAARGLLSAEETDRAIRLARIQAEADRVFGNPDKASRWLRAPLHSGLAPLTMLQSEAGAALVDELLAQIDHGIYP